MNSMKQYDNNNRNKKILFSCPNKSFKMQDMRIRIFSRDLLPLDISCISYKSRSLWEELRRNWLNPLQWSKTPKKCVLDMTQICTWWGGSSFCMLRNVEYLFAYITPRFLMTWSGSFCCFSFMGLIDLFEFF